VAPVRQYGSGPPVVALHGFTLTGEQFAPAASMLGRTVVAPDLPGHGAYARASTDLDRVIDAIATTIGSIGMPVPLLGYSQGGRLALLAALDRPAGISALILVSASPGIENVEERSRRAIADEAMAAHIRQAGVRSFLDSWTSTGVTSTLHLDPSTRETDQAMRLRNTADGLARALTGFGQGAQPSVWRRLSELSLPVLLVTGSKDAKYTAIADDMATLIDGAEHVVIDDAGHNPLADAPEQTYGAVSGFLDRHS